MEIRDVNVIEENYTYFLILCISICLYYKLVLLFCFLAPPGDVAVYYVQQRYCFKGM